MVVCCNAVNVVDRHPNNALRKIHLASKFESIKEQLKVRVRVRDVGVTKDEHNFIRFHPSGMHIEPQATENCRNIDAVRSPPQSLVRPVRT